MATRYSALTLTVFGIGVFLLLTLPTQAADLKIGFIDSERIFRSYKGTSDAQSKLDQEVTEWEKKAEEMRKEVEDLQQELEAQSLLLSEEKKREKEQTLQTKYAEYQQFVTSIWGPQGEAVKRNEELTKPIIEKIDAILKNIGEEEDYTFIFDAVGGGLVFAKPTFDLTDRVIEELNKEAE
ncbi:MAG: OmpH family outer membrane protein [Gemmatimonadota bacterium]|nr:MAG: OmpH family outer membrane protein [Gemmatimonadota bacterium]